ncbi:MAG: Holliday junction branch migration protein RuvA [Gammaproteobacteria bacterium]
MITRIRGILLYRGAHVIELETASGLTYEVRATADTLPATIERGAEVVLYTHMVVRESSMELFGFRTQQHRSLFQKLIGISGVGPRSAQALLSVLAPEDFLIALAAGDTHSLAQAPGIGPKTAKRIIAELQGWAAPSALDGGTTDRMDAIVALQNLSFSATDAVALVQRAVQIAATESEDASTERLIGLALQLADRKNDSKG